MTSRRSLSAIYESPFNVGSKLNYKMMKMKMLRYIRPRLYVKKGRFFMPWLYIMDTCTPCTHHEHMCSVHCTQPERMCSSGWNPRDRKESRSHRIYSKKRINHTIIIKRRLILSLHRPVVLWSWCSCWSARQDTCANCANINTQIQMYVGMYMDKIHEDVLRKGENCMSQQGVAAGL